MAPVGGDGDLALLIQDVVEASKLPPKSRATSIKPTVEQLVSSAYEKGLLPQELSELIDLLTTPSFLDQASLNAIVRNLYPATKVPRDVVIRVVACLGHGRLKATLNVQATLIRWLILVYHTLESSSILSQAYSVLFSLLDTAALRPQLSHLLALITRRKHVKPFRIQALLNWSRLTGNDPCLVGLLRVFKDYYPEIIVGEAVRGRASAFKHPDPLWRERLDDIQAAHIQSTQDLVSKPRDGFKVNRPLGRTQRNRLVPLAQTSHATEDSVTLEEVENASSLAKSLDKLELPNQLVAVLADPLLQKLLLLRPNEVAYQRVAHWLHAILQDVISGNVDSDSLWDIMDVMRDFVKQTKSLPPVLLNFFVRFFELWDGSGRTESLFEILTFVPLHEFHELYTHIFQPFETAVLHHSAHFSQPFMTMYTSLLHQWNAFLQASEDVPDHASKTVGALVGHVNNLALMLIQSSPTVESSSTVLDFYDEYVRLVTDETLGNYIRIELPPSCLIYTLFFSSCLADTSRLCNILACYKRGFENAMANKHRSEGSKRIDALSYDRAYVNRYNGFLMDICNCLWRSRAFSNAETNAHGCLTPRPTVDALATYMSSVDRSISLASVFGLSFAPTLCHQSIQRVRELEDAELAKGGSIGTRHAGPVTQTSLVRLSTAGGLSLPWQDYRISVLDGLSEKGLAGVAELLKCTMTVLKNTMEGRKNSQLVAT